jgi:hypothetical protein
MGFTAIPRVIAEVMDAAAGRRGPGSLAEVLSRPGYGAAAAEHLAVADLRMSNFFYYLAAFALVLGILVVVHELVTIWRRALGRGQGPALFGRLRSSALAAPLGSGQAPSGPSAFPLGGYVKMLDEREARWRRGSAPSFNRQPVAADGDRRCWTRGQLPPGNPALLGCCSGMEPMNSSRFSALHRRRVRRCCRIRDGERVLKVAASRCRPGRRCAGCCCKGLTTAIRSSSK